MGVSVKKSANGTSRVSQKATESTRMTHLEPQVQLQIPPVKVKLQLFPINEETRMGLEKDGHNPFLELTLSARKRISSVLRHLNTKWGNSSVAKGQLMVFPYGTKLEQVASCKRWTSNDSSTTAGEVYADVGSPSIFRLRYGWCSNFLHPMFRTPPKTCLPEGHRVEKHDEYREDFENRTNGNDALHTAVTEQKTLDVPADFVVHPSIPWDDNLTNLSIGGLLSEISMQAKLNNSDPNSVTKPVMQPVGLISDISIGDLLSEASLLGKMCNPGTRPENESSLQPIFLAASDLSIGGLLSEASLLSNKNNLDAQKIEARHAQIESPWFDELTALSIGGLLSEASLQAKAGGGGTMLKDAKSSLLPNTLLSGSSDSLIFSQLNGNSKWTKPSSSPVPNHLSILDAEETCHAFPVPKLQKGIEKDTSISRVGSSGCSKETSSNQNNETAFPKNFSSQVLKTSPSPHSPGAFNEDSSLLPIIHQS
ncbi:Unknown protein [Striga hermonthica]|uniref:TSL-kinase interacting protein 1 n=1 Tax=Striga hermonthica TaxID=68872 RepID=A0A9N7RI74_STRHE|nr:Unknown protein [Striga hermonthica]